MTTFADGFKSSQRRRRRRDLSLTVCHGDNMEAPKSEATQRQTGLLGSDCAWGEGGAAVSPKPCLGFLSGSCGKRERSVV